MLPFKCALYGHISDATEASTCRYRQFDYNQGFQYTTIRIPNTTWISSISETSDWVAVTDPYTIELNAGWRIPTSTEWTTVLSAVLNDLQSNGAAGISSGFIPDLQ